MPHLDHHPVTHDHEAFLARARERPGFQDAYEALEVEYRIANELIAARARTHTDTIPESTSA